LPYRADARRREEGVVADIIFAIAFFLTFSTLFGGFLIIMASPNPPVALLGWTGTLGGFLYVVSGIINPQRGGIWIGLVVFTLSLLWWYHGHKFLAAWDKNSVDSDGTL